MLLICEGRLVDRARAEELAHMSGLNTELLESGAYQRSTHLADCLQNGNNVFKVTNVKHGK